MTVARAPGPQPTIAHFEPHQTTRILAARGRYDQFPVGYITEKTDYIEPVATASATQVLVPLNGTYPTVGRVPFSWNDTKWGPNYFAGACVVLTPCLGSGCRRDAMVRWSGSPSVAANPFAPPFSYRIGVGGPCARFTPPHSYWCQPDGRVSVVL